jgi:hypothetical protein
MAVVDIDSTSKKSVTRGGERSVPEVTAVAILAVEGKALIATGAHMGIVDHRLGESRTRVKTHPTRSSTAAS